MKPRVQITGIEPNHFD